VVIISWWARTTYRCPIQREPAAASSGIDVTSPAPYAKKQKQKQKRRVCVPHRLYCKCWLLLLIAYIRASSLIHSSGYQAATVLASYRKQINQCWGPWWRLLLTVLSPSCGCHQIASYPFAQNRHGHLNSIRLCQSYVLCGLSLLYWMLFHYNEFSLSGCSHQ
jgi:hypothetical protein